MRSRHGDLRMGARWRFIDRVAKTFLPSLGTARARDRSPRARRSARSRARASLASAGRRRPTSRNPRARGRAPRAPPRGRGAAMSASAAWDDPAQRARAAPHHALASARVPPLPPPRRDPHRPRRDPRRRPRARDSPRPPPLTRRNPQSPARPQTGDAGDHAKPDQAAAAVVLL